MGIYKKGNVYWFIKQYKGKRYEESLGTNAKKIAESKYAVVLHKIEMGEYGKKTEPLTFSELSSKYLAKYEKTRDITSLKRLLPYFGEKALTDITAEMVEDYIIERSEQGAAPATVKNEYALGRRMLNIARKRWKLISSNPFSDITFSELLKINNERERFISLEEEHALLEVARPGYLRDIITVALHTGCRRGEILSLTWKDNIDMVKRLITLQASKGGNKKVIPMSDALYETLLDMSKVKHISGKLFNISVRSIREAFGKALKKAGIEDLHFHDLRHSFASRLVQLGVDLYSVSKLLGHKTLSMTQRYAHFAPDSLRPSIKALDNYYNSTTVAAENV